MHARLGKIRVSDQTKIILPHLYYLVNFFAFGLTCYDLRDMKLLEHEGKALFQKHGIPVPLSTIATEESITFPESKSFVVKAQVHTGNRKIAGGIIFAKNQTEAKKALKKIVGEKIAGELVKEALIEEQLDIEKEYYVAFTYDTATRGPVLALSKDGGTGIDRAKVFPIDVMVGLPGFKIREHLVAAKFPSEDILPMAGIIAKLWRVFTDEQTILAEINPLVKTKEGKLYAADSKIDLGKRRLVEAMGGDIAILASGGGASLLNIDALLAAGGKPANYTEYSGNPPAHVVTNLTKQVLSQEGLKGCWVVGGTANFTDIFETIRGFVEGLREVKPKPTYPIVIRRDGPRQKEAFEFLRKVGKEEGYDFHLFGSETAMVSTAAMMVDLAYKHKPAKE